MKICGWTGRQLLLPLGAFIFIVGTSLWSISRFQKSPYKPRMFLHVLSSAVPTQATLPSERVPHQSCHARYPQPWNADLPRRRDEMRWSQCMLPSPPPRYQPRQSAWSDDEPWRKKEAEELSKLVQSELEALQNPSNCNAARLLLCSFDQYCGMGCKLHHVMHCLALAYATKRMMLVVESGFPYQKAGWWGTHFRPLSHTCDHIHFRGVKEVEWTESTALGPHRKVFVPLVSSTKWLPALYPVAVPRHLSQRLFRLHCAPHVWWVGQLLAFLTRPAPKLQARLDRVRAQITFRKPIVGLQVRHTDKDIEAAFHPLKSYMTHAEAFFRHQATKGSPRVYLATDDPSVAREANSSYSQYQWVLQDPSAQLADPKHRFSSQALENVILDLLLLGDSDYLICTFSSNLCRAAFELMQTKFGDASWRVTSLDQPYYVHGQKDYVRTALVEHVTRDGKEFNMTLGDPLTGAIPKDTVHCQGRNEHTKKEGLYLASQALLQTPVADFPTLTFDHRKGP